MERVATMARSTGTKESIVTIDRRRGERRDKPVTAASKPAGEPRRKVQRRRQIDPTTCERDYSNDEVEFMQAIEAYKRKNGRMFPTCSEVLEVIRNLGYAKVPAQVVSTPEAELQTL
jgi:hypothetical protein